MILVYHKFHNVLLVLKKKSYIFIIIEIVTEFSQRNRFHYIDVYFWNIL